MTLALQNSQLEIFKLFEMTPDLVCLAGKDGFFQKVNKAVFDKLEYSETELFSRPISSFIHPDDQERTRLERLKLLEGTALVNFENRYISKTGKICWLHWTSVYLPDNEFVFAIAKDITTAKLAEQEIQEKYRKFKGLATHFKTSIEKDRKYFAVELHEELAQLASVVKMDIEWIGSNTTDLSAFSQERLMHATAITDLLIKTIRRISFWISPHMLEDLGLRETLNWLCDEFAVLNGINCHFESSIDQSALSPEIRMDIFRICQETLSNVIYHAEANNVKIVLELEEGKICLSITDDGRGFEINDMKKTSGFINMRERAASINGNIIIKSEIGIGTVIRLTI
ncbi:hypothetical protein BH11BAC4_BH11BAC4_19360 [soil metagenome]